MRVPNWMTSRTDKRKQNRIARKQEEAAAVTIGGDTTPASGSKWWAKGDAVSEECLVSCKSTKGKRFPLTINDLLETENQAFAKGKRPLWFVDFYDQAGRLQASYVVMNKVSFEE